MNRNEELVSQKISSRLGFITPENVKKFLPGFGAWLKNGVVWHELIILFQHFLKKKLQEGGLQEEADHIIFKEVTINEKKIICIIAWTQNTYIEFLIHRELKWKIKIFDHRKEEVIVIQN